MRRVIVNAAVLLAVFLLALLIWFAFEFLMSVSCDATEC
jgi:hypothetical protein